MAKKEKEEVKKQTPEETPQEPVEETPKEQAPEEPELPQAVRLRSRQAAAARLHKLLFFITIPPMPLAKTRSIF